MVALMKHDNHIAPPQKNNEWYTPARYIEAARLVMGGIDLDPASSDVANQTVKAARYYTKEDNGLAQVWYGRIWLNPPYGRTGNESNIGTFTRRLVAEYRAGNVEQAILLSTTKTDTRWFGLLWDYPICFNDHLIFFVGNTPSPRYNKKYCHIHGTIFVYFGKNEHKFIDTFSQFGTIAKRVSPPKLASTTLWEVR